jgi:hypothetical protein
MCAGAVALPVPARVSIRYLNGSGDGLRSGVSNWRIGAPDSDAARPVDEIVGPVQQSSSQPVAVGAPPARPRDMVSLARQEYWMRIQTPRLTG